MARPIQQGSQPPFQLVVSGECADCKKLAEQLAMAWSELNRRVTALEA